VEKLVDRANTFWRIWAVISSYFMFFVIAIIVVNVLLRRFMNAPIFGSTEIVCYSVLVVSSFAMAQCEWVDGNIRMGLFLESIKNAKTRNIILTIINVVCTIGLVIISLLLAYQVVTKFAHGDASISLHVPMWAMYAILLLGFILLTICFLVKVIINFHTIRTGVYYNLKQYAKEKSGEDMLE
jgi:TRAP-type C4-dicarboxylate transport system permease small subunit